jgi:large repetitive protein
MRGMRLPCLLLILASACGSVNATPDGGDRIDSGSGDTTPPDTLIDDGPAGTTSAASATLTFHATEEGTFACKLDDAAFSTCESPLTVGPLGGGPHTVQIRATDGAGNTDPTPAVATWTIDLPPDTLIDSTFTETGASGTIAFHSTGADVTFTCHLDFNEVTCDTASYTFTDLAEGTHTFTVFATDDLNRDDPTPATITWAVDRTAPNTSMDGPVNAGATTGVFVGEFTFFASETTVTFLCAAVPGDTCPTDFTQYTTCASPYDLRLISAESGSYSMCISAVDRHGNTDQTPERFGWNLDATSPDTAWVSGPAQDPALSTSDLSFVFENSTGSNQFECQWNSDPVFDCDNIDSGIGFGLTTAGSYTLRVWAMDGAGNKDPRPVEKTFTYDPVPEPVTVVNSGPANASTTGANVVFNVSVANKDPRFTYYVGVSHRPPGQSEYYFGGFPEGNIPMNNLAAGQHYVRISASSGGPSDSSPIEITWTVSP